MFLQAEGLWPWFQRGASACRGRWTYCAVEGEVVPVVEKREAAERASLPVRRTLAPMYRPIVAQGEERSRGPAERAPAG
jgi:hypothetical protein